MDDTTKQLWQKLRSNGVDINNLELFIPTVMKGFIYKLNKNLKLRDNLSQHQGLFQSVSSLHQVAKILEFQLQHQSFQ